MKGVFKFMFIALSSLMISAFVCSAAGAPHLAYPGAALLTGLSYLPTGMPTGSLAMALTAKDILFNQGVINPGGIQPGIFYAFSEDIASWPAAMVTVDTETVTSFADIVTVPVADPFVFVAGKSFKKLYCTLETGEVKYSKIGVRDGVSFQQSIEISFPGNNAELQGFLASCANRQMVFLVPEQNGRIKIVGMPAYPAVLDTTEGTSGKAIEDGNASIITFISKAPVPPMIYLPPIALEAAP